MRTTVRRSAVGVLAGLAVVGFAAALLSPTGLAMAEPDPGVEQSTQTAYSLAAHDVKDLTVTIEGAKIKPYKRGEYEVYVKPKPKPKSKPAASGGGGGPAGPPKYTGGGSKEEWMTAAGIAESDWPYVDYIVSHESGWNPNATNAGSGACGLVQALPCSKVPGNGYDPVDNLKWATGYATGRYGSWGGAYNFWSSNHWW